MEIKYKREKETCRPDVLVFGYVHSYIAAISKKKTNSAGSVLKSF